ncbi:hypothetical protein LBMAG10_13640 [Actinomycetes bacterium]|nr:hypothetical protein LBMAG10_13640 [Actinomycetes bacterium]
MAKITGFKTLDVRFPTSRGLDGSDAMNKDVDFKHHKSIVWSFNPCV